MAAQRFKNVLLILLLLGSTHPAFAQTFSKEKLLELAKPNRSAKLHIDKDKVRSLPIFYQQANVEASKIVGNNDVWSGGVAGLNLSGAGIVIGYWDQDQPRLTHQEFSGRVTFDDSEAGSNNNHASLMVGTMLATGIDSEARGMANSAIAKSWNWNNDLSEMAKEAASGLLLSEHPYANTAGWTSSSSYCGSGWTWYSLPSVNTTKAYQFGYYDNQAQLWDSVSYLAPSYLIVKAAGNFRGIEPNSQPIKHWTLNDNFECVQDSTSVRDRNGGVTGFESLSSASVSKNVLVVGAVESSANDFNDLTTVTPIARSGFGPTDDGRIKPDIVAPTNVYSTSFSNDASYGLGGGTSAASAIVAGSAALVREHYQSLFSDTLSSASMRALLAHTADDLGNTGPDYKTGWGLLNTERAARFLSASAANPNKTIRIDTLLTDGNSISIQMNHTTKNPLKVTIAWTDPPGSQPIEGDDPTDGMLINDVDLVVVDSNSVSHFPWILNPDVPELTATNGSNSVDNIEQVYLSQAENGTYTINIEHKGTLTGSGQSVSILASVIEPEIEIKSIASGNWSDPSTWANSKIPNSSFHSAILNHSVTLDSDLSIRTLNLGSETSELVFNGNQLSMYGGVDGNSGYFSGDSLAKIKVYGWDVFSDSIKFRTDANTLRSFEIQSNLDTVLLAGELQILDTLQLVSGILNVQNAELTLNSDSTNAAILLTNKGKILGDISYSRLFDHPGSGWRMISTPVEGGTFSDLNSSTFTQGGLWANQQVDEPNSSLWLYDVEDQQFEGYYGEDSTFTSGQGYLLYLFDKSPNGEAQLPFRMKFTGDEPDSLTINLHRGINDSLSYNLVGNPFVGSLDWHKVVEESEFIHSSYAIWDPAETSNGGSSGFKYYNSVDGLGSAGRYISPLQGFFVQADSIGAALVFKQHQKTGEKSSTYGKIRNEIFPQIHIILKNEAGEVLDEQARIVFADHAHSGKDASDVLRINSLHGVENNVSFEGAFRERLVFEGRSLSESLDEVRLTLNIHQAGTYFLDGSKLETIPNNWEVKLYDEISQSSINLRSKQAYSFFFDPNVEDHSKRFSIKIDKSKTTNGEEIAKPFQFRLEQNYPNPFNPQTTIPYQLARSGHVKLEIFDVTGRLVTTLVDQFQNAGTYTQQFDASHLSSGIYFYRITTSSFVQTNSMVLVK